MKKYSIVFFAVLAILLLPSCTKEKIDENTYDIYYKVEGSDGVVINIIQFNKDDDGGTVVETYPDELEIYLYTSDTYKIKERNAYIVVQASGADASSTLKAQIFKNGVLAKEYTRTGTELGLELGLP